MFQTRVAIVFLVVHSGTLEGPFFMCFIRHNVRGLRYIHESRPRSFARWRLMLSNDVAAWNAMQFWLKVLSVGIVALMIEGIRARGRQ